MAKKVDPNIIRSAQYAAGLVLIGVPLAAATKRAFPIVTPAIRRATKAAVAAARRAIARTIDSGAAPF